MADGLLEQHVRCPYCGESLTLMLDVSAGEQAYVEDCAVCCRPIECRLSWTGGEWTLEVRREDD
jgi:transcription elongation factor Elf1